MSVIYEVNLSVMKEIANEYRIWLSDQVQEMLALPGFTGARILEIVEDASSAETTFCTRYELVDQSALDDFMRVHAGRMRADGVSRFGDRFRASRRALRDAGDY
ncbi:MAG: DUF4286 family protein [Pseudoxanthomonas sp.]